MYLIQAAQHAQLSISTIIVVSAERGFQQRHFGRRTITDKSQSDQTGERADVAVGYTGHPRGGFTQFA